MTEGLNPFRTAYALRSMIKERVDLDARTMKIRDFFSKEVHEMSAREALLECLSDYCNIMEEVQGYKVVWDDLREEAEEDEE